MKYIGKKAQSTLEYAMIIASAVTALVIMHHYFNRSIQGRLKDTADQLGSQYFSSAFSIPLPESGYRASPVSTNYNVGKTVSYSSSSSVNRSTTDFTYEGEKGFVITTSSTSRSENGSLTANADTAQSSASYSQPTTQMEEDTANLRNSALGSSISPDADTAQSNVNNHTSHWGDGSQVTSGNALTTESADSIIVTSEEGQMQAGNEAVMEQIDSSGENIYKTYNPDGNLYDGNE